MGLTAQDTHIISVIIGSSLAMYYRGRLERKIFQRVSKVPPLIEPTAKMPRGPSTNSKFTLRSNLI
jgi:hypothetical protein